MTTVFCDFSTKLLRNTHFLVKEKEEVRKFLGLKRPVTGNKHKLDLRTASLGNIPLSFVYSINVSTKPTMTARERGRELL